MAQSASFRRADFRFTAAVLFGIASSAMLALNGCDNSAGKADKTIRPEMDAATVQMGGSEKDQMAANKTLEDAAREPAASLPQQLRAKTLLGDSELQLAQVLALQVEANDEKIDQLAGEIGLLGNEIQSNNLAIAALAKHEPTAVQDALTQKKTGVAGSDAASVWYKSDAASLAALSNADGQIKDLQGKISGLQDTIKTESDQRNTLLDQADKLTQQSQHEVKDKSVDLYKQGSDARKQAADLTVKIDTDTAALTSAQADLGAWQGLHDSATATVKSIEDKSATFDTDWKAVQAEQTELTSDSKKLLGDDPVNPPAPDKHGDLKTDPTIGSKASAIAALVKKNHELRSTAATHFNSAVGKYNEAFGVANTLNTNLRELEGKVDALKPDQVAWKAEQSQLDPSNYRLLQAHAELQLADFFARSAAEAKVRLDLLAQVKPIIDAAKLTILPTLDDSDSSIAEQLKKDQASARDAYKEAADLLDKTATGTSAADQRAGAQVQLIFAHYGWYQLEAAAGNAQEAGTHLDAAKVALGDAKNNDAVIPQLPPELAFYTPAGAGAPGGAVRPNAPGTPSGAPMFPPR
jgi:hypothetical protein